MLRVRAIIQTINQTAYTAFGLRLESEIPLPELPLAAERNTQPDVEIVIANTKDIWDDTVPEDLSYAVKDRKVYFHIPGAALFCVQDGKRILVAPAAGSDLNLIRVFLLGSCMGAILFQRSILPLHGSAIVIDGKAYAIVGESGAGKSTLAAAFLSQGYRMLSDDVIPTSLSGGSKPFVTPSYPQQKLWQESIEKLQMDTNEYRPLTHEVNKFAVPVTSQFYSESVPLAGVIELVKAEEGEPGIRGVHKLDRFRILNCHTYRNFLVPLLGLEQWHFSFSAAIISHTDIYQLRRHDNDAGFTAHELAAQILETVTKGA